MVAVATSSGICSFSMMISMMAHIIPHTIGISFLMIISNDGTKCNHGQACRSVHDVAAKIITILIEWWILTISYILSFGFIH